MTAKMDKNAKNKTYRPRLRQPIYGGTLYGRQDGHYWMKIIEIKQFLNNETRISIKDRFHHSVSIIKFSHNWMKIFLDQAVSK